MRIGEHETHPAADQLPLLEGQALQNLVDDIKANGQRVPIVLLGENDQERGLILDGRNRYRACLLAHEEPTFINYAGATDPASLANYVASMNLSRRDLDESQRAIAARRLVNWLSKQIKRSKHQPVLPNVDPDTDALATAVLEDGSPELVAAVDRGEVPLAVAAEVAKLEPERQRAVLERASEPEPETKRAQQVNSVLEYPAGQLSSVDLHKLQVGAYVWDKSPHAEARGAAEVLRRIVPGVRR